MKLDELIKVLDAAKHEYGDIEVDIETSHFASSEIEGLKILDVENSKKATIRGFKT